MKAPNASHALAFFIFNKSEFSDYQALLQIKNCLTYLTFTVQSHIGIQRLEVARAARPWSRYPATLNGTPFNEQGAKRSPCFKLSKQ